MPVIKSSRPRSNSQKSDSSDKGKKKIKPSKSKTGLKSSSSSSTKSSPDSGGPLVISSSGETAKITRTSNLTPSENERNYPRKMSSKSKLKVRSKLKKKASAKEKAVPVIKAPQENTHSFGKPELESIESLTNNLNETLRWHNVCSDSEDEEERLRIYKEQRRKRYAEARQVKVVQRMAEK